MSWLLRWQPPEQSENESGPSPHPSVGSPAARGKASAREGWRRLRFSRLIPALRLKPCLGSRAQLLRAGSRTSRNKLCPSLVSNSSLLNRKGRSFSLPSMLWTDLNQSPPTPKMRFPHVCPLLTRVVVLTPVKRWGRKAVVPGHRLCRAAAGMLGAGHLKHPVTQDTARLPGRCVWVPGCWTEAVLYLPARLGFP